MEYSKWIINSSTDSYPHHCDAVQDAGCDICVGPAAETCTALSISKPGSLFFLDFKNYNRGVARNLNFSETNVFRNHLECMLSVFV